MKLKLHQNQYLLIYFQEKDKERENLRDELLKYNISQKPARIYTYSNVSKITFLSSKKAILYTTYNSSLGNS